MANWASYPDIQALSLPACQSCLQSLAVPATGEHLHQGSVLENNGQYRVTVSNSLRYVKVNQGGSTFPYISPEGYVQVEQLNVAGNPGTLSLH